MTVCVRVRSASPDFPSLPMSLAGAQFLRHPPARFGQSQPYRVVPRCWLVVVADEALMETVHGHVDRFPRGERSIRPGQLADLHKAVFEQ